MKFIHIGDAHLRDQTWANLSAVSGDALKACQKVHDYALNNNISVIVLSGDVFHSSKPTSKDIEVFNHLIEPFTHVLFIEGNHETAKPMWLESLHNDKIIHLNQFQGLILDGAAFYGIDYSRSREELINGITNVLKCMPTKKDFLVMHCGFQHMINFEGASQLGASDVSWFPGTVLVSHVHKRKTYRNIHSPGPLFPQNWEEIGPCFVDIIDTDTGEISGLDVTVRDYRVIGHSEVASFVDTPKELPTVVKVIISDPNVPVPVIPGCIVVPSITGASDVYGSSVSECRCMSIEEAIRAEYEDDDDSNIMIDLYKSDSPKDYIDRLLKDNNIERRSL